MIRAKDIVRALANRPALDENGFCWLCFAPGGSEPRYHEPYCAWADAVRWVRAADRRSRAMSSTTTTTTEKKEETNMHTITESKKTPTSRLRHAPIPSAAELDAILAGVEPATAFQIPEDITMSHADRLALIRWADAAAQPHGPYRILVVQGPPASGKTRLLHALLAHLGGCWLTPTPRSVTEIVARTEGEKIVAVDDVATLPQRLRDGLTLISRGGSTALRRRPHGAFEICDVVAWPVAIASAGIRTTWHNRDFLAGCTTITLSGVRQ